MYSSNRRGMVGAVCVASLTMAALSACASPAVSASPAADIEPRVSSTPTPTPEYAGPEVERDHEEMDTGSFDADSATVDNPWLPLVPGTRFVYKGTTVDKKEKFAHTLEFTVTDLTKRVAGVNTVVAYAVDYEEDELVEKEVAFFAQDSSGSVWYLGEHPEEFEDGEFDKAPTWIHGVSGAKAGFAMPANPRAGTPSFSEGWAPKVDFLDRGRITGFEPEVCTKLKCYADVLVIDEFTRAEPNAVQVKYYANGVGNVKVGWRGDDTQKEELELDQVTRLDPKKLADVRTRALTLEEHAYLISPTIYGTTEPMRRTSA